MLAVLREFPDEEFHQRGLARARIALEDKHAVWRVVDKGQNLLQHLLLAGGQLDA